MSDTFYTTLAAEVGQIVDRLPDAQVQHTISIRPNDSMTLRFVYKDSCASRVPQIFVQYSKRRPHKITEKQLECELQAKAEDIKYLNMPMLPTLVEHAKSVDDDTSRKSEMSRGKYQTNATATNTDNTGVPEPTVAKQSAPRCNYFVAIRCSNSDVGNSLEKVIDELASRNSVYREACYNRHEIHVTLCTLALYSQNEMDQAVRALQDMKNNLVAYRPKKPLNIARVSEFGNRKVLYAQIQAPAVLQRFQSVVAGGLRKAGVVLTDEKSEYTPHMTIGNITGRFRTNHPEVENFPEDVMKKFRSLKFGLQNVEGVHLCKMGDERREDGFYTCLTEVMF